MGITNDEEISDAPPDVALEETPEDQFWLTEPPSETSIVLTIKRGEPDLPAPIHITESDLAPE